MWLVIILSDYAALSRLPHLLVFSGVFQTAGAHRTIPKHWYKKNLLMSSWVLGTIRCLKTTVKKKAMDTSCSHGVSRLDWFPNTSQNLEVVHPTALRKRWVRSCGNATLSMKALLFHFFIFTVREVGGKFEERDSWMVTIHSLTSKVTYPRYEKWSVSDFLLHKLTFT